MSIARGPDILMIPIPPLPGGVEIAAMVGVAILKFSLLFVHQGFIDFGLKTLGLHSRNFSKPFPHVEAGDSFTFFLDGFFFGKMINLR